MLVDRPRSRDGKVKMMYVGIEEMDERTTMNSSLTSNSTARWPILARLTTSQLGSEYETDAYDSSASLLAAWSILNTYASACYTDHTKDLQNTQLLEPKPYFPSFEIEE
jgi:hypothetical protein